MKKLYLCGAINGCSDSEAKDWRECVKTTLAGSYEFLDPMRRDYRGRETTYTQEIVELDLFDIRASDIILVAADKPSWGTAMEVFYAHDIGKPVLVVCGAESISPWLRYHATDLVETLDHALSILQTAAG